MKKKIMAHIKRGKSLSEFENNKIAFLTVIATSPARGRFISMNFRENGHVVLELEDSGHAIIEYLNPYCESISYAPIEDCALAEAVH